MAEVSASSPEGALLFHLISQRYGERLTPAELAEVEKGVAGLADAAAALRTVRLDNSLEPFTVFVPYCQEE